MPQAKGTFEVQVKPISAEGESVMRMSIDKQFSGALEGTSVGQMTTLAVEANGSRVYVALETVTGSLDGKQGSFILAHRASMTKAKAALSVVVADDSGTGALVGIAGDMKIEIVDKKHLYTFEYTLP